MGEVVGVYLAAHTPRYCTRAAAFDGKLAHPDFRALRDGLVEQGRHLEAAKPDVIVINSCHLVSTFSTLVDGTAPHRGVLTAQEAPDLIFGVEFDFPGDRELSAALVARGKAAGHLAGLVDDLHYPLDYGTVMPIVCYLDPGQTIPVVPISVTLLNDLEECFQWGRYVAQALREGEKRGVFVASGALSHRLVRGPEKWPLPEDRKLDERFAYLLSEGDYEAAWKWLPEFASAVDAEMGGRHLAMMLGVLEEAGSAFTATVHAYGPSSGSGNYAISFAPSDSMIL
ncbi:MAG: extradiol ring-cleavage dioxygenase [Vicinamibacteria bacterium]